jgi:hypothetical protein
MVYLGSIIFTIKNDLIINTFSPITGIVTDIGGVHGTSFCDDNDTRDICSRSNTEYGSDLPSSNECLFVYYKKIIK